CTARLRSCSKGLRLGRQARKRSESARRCDRGMFRLRWTVLPRCGGRRTGELLSDDCRGLRAPPSHAGREELLYGVVILQEPSACDPPLHAFGQSAVEPKAERSTSNPTGVRHASSY